MPAEPLVGYVSLGGGGADRIRYVVDCTSCGRVTIPSRTQHGKKISPKEFQRRCEVGRGPGYDDATRAEAQVVAFAHARKHKVDVVECGDFDAWDRVKADLARGIRP